MVVSGNFNRHIESNHCSATFFVLFFIFGRKKVVFFISVTAENDIVFFGRKQVIFGWPLIQIVFILLS